MWCEFRALLLLFVLFNDYASAESIVYAQSLDEAVETVDARYKELLLEEDM